MIEHLMWAVTAASIVGVLANNNRKRWGFMVWIFTNGLCVAYSIHKGSPAQAVKYAVFAALAVDGFRRWGVKTS